MVTQEEINKIKETGIFCSICQKSVAANSEHKCEGIVDTTTTTQVFEDEETAFEQMKVEAMYDKETGYWDFKVFLNQNTLDSLQNVLDLNPLQNAASVGFFWKPEGDFKSLPKNDVLLKSEIADATKISVIVNITDSARKFLDKEKTLNEHLRSGLIELNHNLLRLKK